VVSRSAILREDERTLATQAQRAYQALDARMFADTVRPTVTPALIAEHRRSPFGSHTDPLERLLRYLRRNACEPSAFAVVHKRAEDGWLVARIVDGLVRVESDELFESRAEAEHAIFLHRLRGVGLVA
jgi:hypothetical protein